MKRWGRELPLPGKAGTALQNCVCCGSTAVSIVKHSGLLVCQALKLLEICIKNSNFQQQTKKFEFSTQVLQFCPVELCCCVPGNYRTGEMLLNCSREVPAVDIDALSLSHDYD